MAWRASLPGYYIAIALLVIVPLVAAAMGHAPSGPRITVSDVIKQLVFLDSGTRFVNPSYWTLSVEARWLLFFPLALVLWIRSRRAFGIVAALAMLSTFTRAGSLDMFFLPAFLLGIIAADLR